ncbi:MAG: LSM domain-containing protein [Candidatus Hodarchaeota archaeon]
MRSPISYLQKQEKKKIVVRLKNGVSYEGRLLQHDNYMNLVIAECIEIDREGRTTRLGKAFLRGSNILFMKLDG